MQLGREQGEGTGDKARPRGRSGCRLIESPRAKSDVLLSVCMWMCMCMCVYVYLD